MLLPGPSASSYISNHLQKSKILYLVLSPAPLLEPCKHNFINIYESDLCQSRLGRDYMHKTLLNI